MTDAPERMWIAVVTPDGTAWRKAFDAKPEFFGSRFSAYIRADLHEAQLAALRDRVEALQAFAEECASYTCTCNAAFYERGLVDPDCMSGEVGYEAQEVLGLPVTCKGILASRERRSARKDT